MWRKVDRDIEAFQTNGTVSSANFFLINPNGIIFGPKASLNIGGSFLATTADSIKFVDNTQFSAVNPQTAPLLTVSVPIGLQFGQNPREIRNASIAPLIDISTGNPVLNDKGEPLFGGLQLTSGKTLALVGGSITFPGGVVKVEDGRIELGSVGDADLVSLFPSGSGWTLGYEGIKNFQNIQFFQSATLDVSGFGGGSIQVQGEQVILTGESGIGSASLENRNGGEITIRASRLTKADGNTSGDVANIKRCFKRKQYGLTICTSAVAFRYA